MKSWLRPWAGLAGLMAKNWSTSKPRRAFHRGRVIGSPIVNHCRRSCTTRPSGPSCELGALAFEWFQAGPGGGALGGMRSLGVAGLSVTMPTRPKWQHWSTPVPSGGTLGSVNCIINEGGQLRAPIRRDVSWPRYVGQPSLIRRAAVFGRGAGAQPEPWCTPWPRPGQRTWR